MAIFLAVRGYLRGYFPTVRGYFDERGYFLRRVAIFRVAIFLVYAKNQQFIAGKIAVRHVAIFSRVYFYNARMQQKPTIK